jgi:hypothetical protein
MKICKTVILIAIFLINFTACANTGVKNSESPSLGAAQTEDVSTESPSGRARYTDDGRRIITIGTWYDRYYVSKHTSIYDDPSLSDEVTAQLRIDKMREVEEKYNIVLEYINLTFDGIQESINSSIPSGYPDVDIYEADIQFGIPAVLNDYAISLEEIGLSGTDIFKDQTVMKYLNLMGQDESYLFAPSNSGGMGAYPLAFNLDLIEAAGLENPQDVYDRGEWTWEVWRSYLKTLTVDSNSDGVVEVYGFSGYWTYLLSNLLMTNNTGIATGPVEMISSPATKQVFDFINDLYNVDKTARPWDQSNWEINNKLYAEKLSAFWIGADWIFSEQGGPGLPFEIGIVPWPTGPNGNYLTDKCSQPQRNWYFIPRGVEDPSLVYDIMYDWINWYDGDLEVGVDMKWSKSMYMTERNFDYAMMMSSKPGLDIWESLGVDFSLVTMLIGQRTPEQLAVDFKDIYQEALTDYFR